MTRRIPYRDTWTPVEGQSERGFRVLNAAPRTEPCRCKHCFARIQAGDIFCTVCREGRHYPRCQAAVTHR